MMVFLKQFPFIFQAFCKENSLILSDIHYPCLFSCNHTWLTVSSDANLNHKYFLNADSCT